MEYLFWTTVVVLLIHCMAVQSFPRSTGHATDCRKCKPGYFASSLCTDTRDTRCQRCPDGHFTSEWNVRTECYPCSKCGQGLFELKQCSRTSDVFCESCASTESKSSARYKEYCWGLEPDAADLLSDQPEPGENKDGSVMFDKGNGSYLLLGENDGGGEKDEEVSSGEVALLVQDIPKGKDGEDGSKTTVLQDKQKDDLTPQDITEVDLEEGSGYVISEESTMDEELSDLLSQAATVEPNEAQQDELIPVGTSKTTANPLDVVDLDLDEDGSGGLVIEDLTNITLAEPVKVTDPPVLTEETSDILVEINYSGEGEEIVDGSTPTSQDIVVLTVAQTTTKLPAEFAEGGENVDENAELPPPEENKVEASIDEEPLAQGGMNGKTRTAVIVGVAVGAVIFFALGFFASRQCKKRHAFKSMKKLDSPEKTLNGSPEAIEFRGGRNSGKYDPGAYERSPPISPQTESVVLLSSKPLPIDHSGLASQDKHVNGIDKIKYMDETTDDEAESATPRDRLIKETGASKNEEEEKANNSLSNDVMNKFDDKLAPIEEERQPMLTKESGVIDETS